MPIYGYVFNIITNSWWLEDIFRLSGGLETIRRLTGIRLVCLLLEEGKTIYHRKRQKGERIAWPVIILI